MKNFERLDKRDGFDVYGVIRFMCESGGYVMARRPRAAPMVFTLKEWARIPKEPNNEHVADLTRAKKSNAN